MLDFFKSQLLSADVVVTVESAVYAVILTVVGNIKRCKNIDSISKMILRDFFCLPSHLFQVRSCCRRDQRLKILYGTGLMRKSPLHVRCSVSIIIKFIHGFEHFILDIGLYDLHSFHVFHMVGTEGRILFQTMLSLKSSRRQCITVYKIYLIFFIHDRSSLMQKSCQRI